MKQISILGCGWLGLPLAKSLLKKGFSIKGSTTSVAKIPVLEAAGIKAFQIEVKESMIEGAIQSLLDQSEILIIDIPPKLRGLAAENFVKKMENLTSFIEQSSVEKVIFVSSTAVYPDDNNIVTEETQPKPDTESGRQLLETELLLHRNSNFKTTVVRFGGLIGEDRHPVHFLSGQDNIENPEAPINLIHLEDCIGIIESIIEEKCWGQTFNAVAPFHPTRKYYYTQKALELGLPLPGFSENRISAGKIIQGNLIESELNYTFKKPNL
ncbi:SDR family NAD(P)-dependent oxidoreductase [Flavobacterium silvisoli]|uniref:SDR family NAD(P)-dependent oxidoreductase n=1 Tax=Flavobacterium silvisoli TaxID=2529433 RepID=A0A4Q9Z4W8_9FLAO|nr:NAD(P)H-binding protein [Flavobacterium silvisoli]TBX71352.1 SDR family NAD(P)-dependent oxidoreductase [Flavobacterium silvisoli]